MCVVGGGWLEPMADEFKDSNDLQALFPQTRLPQSILCQGHNTAEQLSHKEKRLTLAYDLGSRLKACIW